MFRAKVVEEIKLRSLCSRIPPSHRLPYRAVYEIMWKNISERDRPQMAVCYCACGLHASWLSQEYRHTFRIYNAYYYWQQCAILCSSANGTNCCVCMATMNTFIWFTTTHTPTTIKRELFCVPMAKTVKRTRRDTSLHVHWPYVSCTFLSCTVVSLLCNSGFLAAIQTYSGQRCAPKNTFA